VYKIYNILSFLLIPIIYLNIYLRLIKNKEDKIRYKERFGKTSIKRPNKKIIWIHAASIGEFKSCKTLIEAYHNEYCILVTTTTKTAADYAVKNFSRKIIHQYAPFDVTLWVNRFINFWKPKLVLWIESDLWPNTLLTIKKKNIKSLFINARISPASFKRWKKTASSYNDLLNTFSYIFAQSKEDLKRLSELTNRKIEFIGNLKLSNINVTQNFKSEINNQKIKIMLASTHKGEELKLLNFVKNLIYNYPKIQFYIAPRHISRTDKIKKILDNERLSNCLENQDSDRKIIIINSFGNLPKYFNKSDIVILGGSFTKDGGHNPIEPALFNCAIISGQHMFNWQNIYEEMLEEKACYISNDILKLENYVVSLINDKKMLIIAKENALKFTNKSFFDKNKLKDIINNSLLDNA